MNSNMKRKYKENRLKRGHHQREVNYRVSEKEEVSCVSSGFSLMPRPRKNSNKMGIFLFRARLSLLIITPTGTF